MKSFFAPLLVRFLTAKKSTQKKSQLHVSGKQSGQALIVILAFSAILGAGLLSIYNTAQLSTSKRELVNAADATAYSGASIIAQGLNYTAYTNRAILANNALIGQMVTMRSTLAMTEWYWKTNENNWNAIQRLTAFIPVVGEVVSPMAAAAKTFAQFFGEEVVHPVRVMGEILQAFGTASVGLSNHAIWLSQQVMLADSLVGFELNMVEIAKQNAPDAKIDLALHLTAFGPVATVGMFAQQFKVKVRKSKDSIGTLESKNDEYLNYLTDNNRNVTTPPYLGGRTLFPNAVGLWMAKGCGIKPILGLTNTAFKPTAGLGGGFDTVVQVLSTFSDVMGVLADPIMCFLYDRNGGSELVQLADGKMAWVAIDVMAFKIPILSQLFPGVPLVPVAGGAVMSFTEVGKSQESYPQALKQFRKHVTDYPYDPSDPDFLKDRAQKYMGHQSALPADCVEFLRPDTLKLTAVSTDGRTSGNCAVLATGVDTQSVDKGLWGGKFRKTTDKAINSPFGDSDASGVVNGIVQPLETLMVAATADLKVALDGAAAPTSNPANGLVNQGPPGTSRGVNAATTGLPDTEGLTNAGGALKSWAAGMTGGVAITGITQRLDKSNFNVNPASIVASLTGVGSGSGGSDGGVSAGVKVVLEVTGLDALIDMFSMKISDGVETPRKESMNKVFNIIADGLPKYFWDVRITEKTQSTNSADRENLVFTDDKPDDYNPRRYNLGPLVYLPLTQEMDKIKTAANLGIGGTAMGLPDYDDNTPKMRAIGKARIFFRQPSDQWSNRYKVVITASLIMPYWQVRNESLSYADKWGLLALDKATDLYKDTAFSNQNDVPDRPARWTSD